MQRTLESLEVKGMQYCVPHATVHLHAYGRSYTNSQFHWQEHPKSPAKRKNRKAWKHKLLFPWVAVFLESPFWNRQGAFVTIETAAIKCSSCLQIPWWNCRIRDLISQPWFLSVAIRKAKQPMDFIRWGIGRWYTSASLKMSDFNSITLPVSGFGCLYGIVRDIPNASTEYNRCFTTPSYWSLTWQRPMGRLRQTRSHSQIRWPANVLTDWLQSNFNRNLDHDSSLVDIVYIAGLKELVLVKTIFIPPTQDNWSGNLKKNTCLSFILLCPANEAFQLTSTNFRLKYPTNRKKHMGQIWVCF